MPGDLCREGFAAGWLAASTKLIEAMPVQAVPSPASLELAGNLPVAPRRRGRPPKAVVAIEPVKRKRGRPPKNKAEKA
jgi:AT hook motif